MNRHVFTAPPILENEKIRLEPMTESHAQDLYKLNTPDIWTYMLREIVTLEEMQAWMGEAIQLREKKLALPFIVRVKGTNKIAGTTRLFDINPIHRSCELGSTWYGREYQRTFVNSACKAMLLGYCFETLGMIRVQFKTDERNERSQKAIERLGAVKEGVLRNERILSNGYIRNAVVYSITNEEWPAVKEQFGKREKRY
ncbi:GNAT family N-acetyltransferase [Bacillus sp. KH172YL63]|uniref:GNAT family N-acetyltransferase n=1 Tax=Bacillus sp. KH172YL63 TaxID=2709784 RepID=UPI0013E5075D|nr:GNAT family protein [Bacillus sp. KH172YL63]BCB02542.1 N-acetyltransferase [Bacillus sp. KH172YL63]